MNSKYGKAWMGGVQMRSTSHMGWGFRRILGRVGGELSSLARFEMGDNSKIRLWHNV